MVLISNFVTHIFVSLLVTMNLISDMVGEAFWYKWTTIIFEPSEVENKQSNSTEGGEQSNCFVRDWNSQRGFFGTFVGSGEPAKGAGGETDVPS